MTDSPPPAARRLVALDPPMLPLAVAGTVTWFVLGLVLLALRSTLARGGNENWIGICFTGAGLSLVGVATMARHDYNRRRRASHD